MVKPESFDDAFGAIRRNRETPVILKAGGIALGAIDRIRSELQLKDTAGIEALLAMERATVMMMDETLGLLRQAIIDEIAQKAEIVLTTDNIEEREKKLAGVEMPALNSLSPQEREMVKYGLLHSINQSLFSPKAFELSIESCGLFPKNEQATLSEKGFHTIADFFEIKDGQLTPRSEVYDTLIKFKNDKYGQLFKFIKAQKIPIYRKPSPRVLEVWEKAKSSKS